MLFHVFIYISFKLYINNTIYICEICNICSDITQRYKLNCSHDICNQCYGDIRLNGQNQNDYEQTGETGGLLQDYSENNYSEGSFGDYSENEGDPNFREYSEKSWFSTIYIYLMI